MTEKLVAKFKMAERPVMKVRFTMPSAGSGGTKDHDQLNNRDLPDQHPISAITGLEEALNSKQDNLNEAQQSAVDSGITSTKVGNYDTHIANKNNPHEVTKEQVGLGNVDNTSDLNKPISTATQTALTNLGNDISSEVTNRQNADNSLQSQIDALVVSSDVFDVVGTYAELQAYDISKVPVNDIIKVLVDSTHDNAATYYRCIKNGDVKSWSYIGAEGAYYTKAEADGKFVPLTRTVNNKALSSDITLGASDVGAVPTSRTVNGKALSSDINLNASDVGALPDSTVIPTVNNKTITIQKNGADVDSFTLNQTTDKTINISVPTKTSDLQNDSGFLTSHQSIKTLKTDNTTAQSTSSSEAIAGTGTINLHKVSKTGSYNDLLNKPTIPTKVSELQNDSGFTSNAGTVTSVRVQAGTGLTSSQSTAQSSSLDTTIGIDSNYKLPTNTEFNAKENKPTILTDQSSTNMALAGNTIYKWTNAITTLTIASAEVSDNETLLYFTAGASITFTDSSNIKWGGDGTAPALEINTRYCIAIKNGFAEFDTFGTTV